MIAICMPELHGDVLWSIPAARELARRAGCKADYIITRKAERVADLLLAQSFVRGIIVHENYTWPQGASHDMDVNIGYDAIHQMGFRAQQPIDETLLDYFCKIAGLPRQGHWLDLPTIPYPTISYVVLAAKKQDGSMHERWGNMWDDFVSRCPMPVFEVGHPDHAMRLDWSIDGTSIGFLKMACLISRCKYFFGHISAPLVIADAIPDVVRVAVHDGVHWNLRACTQSPMNHYPVCYDAGTLLEYIK